MSADRRQSLRGLRPWLIFGLAGLSGLVAADDVEAPDLEFLEYLGSWETSEEDWVLLAPDMAAEETPTGNGDESADAPDGDKLAELNDES
jgi:hypothetical protein